MPKRNKFKFKFLLVGIALFVALSLPSIWATPSVAQEVTFNPPGDPAPKRTSGGASRDGSSCGLAKELTTGASSVTPLLPKSNIGLTVAKHPSIFVYVPKTSAKKAFFSLQDQDSHQHYQTNIDLPDKSGIVEIKLPNSDLALSSGKNYQWSLAMICTEALEPDSPVVSGWIRRVEPLRNVAKQPTATLESVAKLAKRGLWYDSLSTLAQLRRSQPNNQALTASWQQLLKSVGLEAVATEPLVN